MFNLSSVKHIFWIALESLLENSILFSFSHWKCAPSDTIQYFKNQQEGASNTS